MNNNEFIIEWEKEVSAFDSFIEYKKEKISSFYHDSNSIKNDLNNIERTINNIWNNLDNYKNKKHLVVGHVQSGKTDFMIGLIAKAIDNIKNDKTTIIINLTSNLTNIMNQNKERLENFLNNRCVINKNVRYWSYDFLKNKKKIREDENSIFFLLKNLWHLNNLKKHLLCINEEFGEKIEKIIILDDEGDNASFNTNETTSKEELSKINKLISDIIYHDFKFHVNFVSITATPFVHFFTTNTNNLKPDFVYLLRPGKDYSGIMEFNETMNEKDSNVIVSIKNEEIEDIEDDENILNGELKKSILCFLLTNALTSSSENHESRMIINVSPLNDYQSELLNKIDEWLNDYKQNKERFLIHIENFEVFELIGKKDFGYDFMSNKKNQQKLIDYVYEKYILLNKYELILYNKDNPENTDLSVKLKNNPQLVIGSFKLSRGITINDLLCVYMSYRPKRAMADTLLQRARWFGYRQKYLSKMRIFLTEELIDDYLLIGELCSNLYYIVEKAEEKNISFRQIEKFLSASNANPYIIPVSKNRALTDINIGNFKNVFINNRYKNNDLVRLKNVFVKEWEIRKEKEKETNYPIIKFDSLMDFISSWFTTKEKFYESIHLMDSKEINEIEDNYLNKETYVRFICKDIENIKYRDRKVIHRKQDNSLNFGNGNYEGETNTLVSSDGSEMIKIDLLPLRIWEKNEDFESNNQDVNIKIFRLKMVLPLTNENENFSKTGYQGFD